MLVVLMIIITLALIMVVKDNSEFKCRVKMEPAVLEYTKSCIINGIYEGSFGAAGFCPELTKACLEGDPRYEKNEE